MTSTLRSVAKSAVARSDRAISRLSDRLFSKNLVCIACRQRTSRFSLYGDARHVCPNCGALGRERWVRLALEAGLLSIPEGGRILHIAPRELSLVKEFSRHCGYIPAAPDPSAYPLPGVRPLSLMNLADMAPLDLIYASHVLRPLPEERRALREMYRALRPEGEAWILVPLDDWQDGHMEATQAVVARLEAAGFVVEALKPEVMGAAQHCNGLLPDDVIFRCVKPAMAEARALERMMTGAG